VFAASERATRRGLWRVAATPLVAVEDACVRIEGRRRQRDAADSAPLSDAVNSDALTSRRSGRLKEEDEQHDDRRGYIFESSVQLSLSFNHPVWNGRLIPT